MRTPDELNAWAGPAAKYWSAQFKDEPPLQPLAKVGGDFYGAVPLLGASAVEIPLDDKGAYILKFLVGRKIRACSDKAPLHKVTAHVLHARSGQVVAYLRAYLLGPVKSLETLEALTTDLQGLSIDFRRAMEALVATHVTPTDLLSVGLACSSLVHLDMLEVSSYHKGKGLGVLALQELSAQLAQRKGAALLTYRPYPLQFANEHALGAEFSHHPRAVAAYKRFLEAQATLSRHYAKHLASSRLPDTDYFIKAIEGGGYSLSFNSLLRKWAMLPDPAGCPAH